MHNGVARHQRHSVPGGDECFGHSKVVDALDNSRLHSGHRGHGEQHVVDRKTAANADPPLADQVSQIDRALLRQCVIERQHQIDGLAHQGRHLDPWTRRRRSPVVSVGEHHVVIGE